MPEAGQTLSHYRLIEKIGEGGMGVVWRAEDTKLRRDVALKFLPEGIARNPERLARFEREARMLAALNDSNVAAIFEMEETDDEQFLVLEYVPGVSLAERLKKGALPVQEALKICCDLARGLEAAHAKGMIHRDLKPANVQLTPEGKVKVLDFGLAKALCDVVAADERSQQMTVTAATGEYVVVGTVPYMSPEQAAAMPVDKRTDVWAFGCILYELLTGERAFAGETVSNTLTKIQGKDPEWKRLPVETPLRIRELLRHCLIKDADDRLHDIADARIEIADALAGKEASGPAERASPTRSLTRSILPWSVVAILSVVLVFLLLDFWRPPPHPSRGRLVAEVAPVADEFERSWPRGGLTISPDGRHVTFTGRSRDGRSGLWLRPLDGSPSRLLPGTEGAYEPFWSSDNRFIAFFVGTELRRTDVSGTPAVTLCEVEWGRKGAWNAAGDILFSHGPAGPILRVSAEGGEPEPVTRLDEEAGETTHRWARFLPDGEHFIYLAGSHTAPLTGQVNGIYVQHLHSDTRKLLVRGRSNASYAEGHLLWVRGDSLLAQPLDLRSLELTGESFRVVEDVDYAPNAFQADFAVEGDLLAYRTGRGPVARELRWLDLRDGSLSAAFEGAVGFTGAGFSFSPDGKRLVLEMGDPRLVRSDLWLQDVSRGVRTRLTSDPNGAMSPVWSPDGNSVIYTGGPGDDPSADAAWGRLAIQSLTGGAAARPLLETSGRIWATDWSEDGRFLVYQTTASIASDWDVFALPMIGDDRTPIPVLGSRFDEQAVELSRDGRWLLYLSDETGSQELYVTRFPEAERGWRLSAPRLDEGQPTRIRGGAFGAHDSVVYVVSDDEITSVPVDLREPSPVIGQPRLLASLPSLGAFDVEPGEERMLVTVGQGTRPDRPEPRLKLVANWPSAR